MVPAKSYLGLSVNSWNSWNLYLGVPFFNGDSNPTCANSKTITLFSGEAVR